MSALSVPPDNQPVNNSHDIPPEVPSVVEKITVHAYDWKVKDYDKCDENGHLVIHCWALDRDSKPYLLRFHDFPAFCFVELPLFVGNRRTNWTGYKAQQVYETICWMLGEDKPYNCLFKQCEKFYYYRGGKKYPMLVLLFNSAKGMNECKKRLSKPLNVKDIGKVACKVWETKIPIVRKLLTLRKIMYCQWFNIEGVKARGEDKISTVENEYVVDRSTMNGIAAELTSSWVTQPTLMSFDIETYSDKHKALPDPYASKHVAYMISCVFQRVGDPSSRKKYIILYGDCNPTEYAEVIKVKSEIEGFDTMTDLVIKHDPEIVTGYNIFGYDLPFIDTRIKRRLREWKPMGRLINTKTELQSFSWGSSGYGHNEINMLEADGRIFIDLLPVIKRDFKLNLYNLGFVSNYFLGRTKHPITAKEMFETYELNLAADKNPDISLHDYMIECKKMIGREHDIYSVRDLYKYLHLHQFMETEDKEFIIDSGNIPQITLKQYALSEMTKVVNYCVVDSDLVVDLFDKINCWIALVEMSNVVGVTPVELFTRGQQLRVLSQVYNEASTDNIVIDERIVPKMDYSGGFVFDPNPGIYHYIPVLDFKSLYPTIMIAYNICPRSFVPPEMMDQIPDEMCHVIEWDEEVDKTDDYEKDDMDLDDDNNNNSNEKVVETVHYRYKFIKQEHQLGILPRLLVKLIEERDAIRRRQKQLDPNSIEWSVLEQRQLAVKVSANSMYGALGAQAGGKIPLPEGAACVTARARESIKMVNADTESRGNKVIYGDTDSSMPDIGIKDPTQAYAMAKVEAERLSKLFPPPMLVEDEEVYHTMLCIKKKMYICVKMNRDGTPVMGRDKLKFKGVAPARRDNCQYKRDAYIDTAMKVLWREPLMDTFNFIVDLCLKLVRREVPWEELIFIKGLGAHYKNKSYCMKIFSDELCKIGKPATPGERLEYLIVKSHGVEGQQLLGYKMRLPSTYLERLDSDNPEHIDYEYYLEKALMNCIQKQLFQIGYKTELKELADKYLDIDRTKVINALKAKGYEIQVVQLLAKFKYDKGMVINHLMGVKEMQKIIKPLVSFHIKKRKRLVTRVSGEPIKMMLKLIKAKQEYLKDIKKLVRVSDIPKLRPARLNVVNPSDLNTNKAKEWANKMVTKLNPRLNIVKPVKKVVKLNIVKQ